MVELYKILRAKFPQASFLKDIVLQDDGKGSYIKEWNLPDKKPSENALNVWANELDLEIRQQTAVSKRVYKPWQEQLDMQYNDHINNTNTWIEYIASVKQANPKPTE